MFRFAPSMLVLFAALVAGCASAPPTPSDGAAQWLRDDLFSGTERHRDDAQAVFALSDAMKDYLRITIARQLRDEGLSRGLIDALYRRDQLKLEYDASRTRNAAEAFEARKGNCLSLVLMTAAFAKELGLRVTYQSVVAEEMWSRVDDIAFLNRHVNLTLSTRPSGTWVSTDRFRSLTIDFLPSDDLLGQRTTPISEDAVVAMYMNNLAAESLAKGELDDAYAWARGAVLRAPDFLDAFNTLGVIYLRHGNPQDADRVFGHVLDRQPDDRLALSNAALALQKLGRDAASATMRTRLARLETTPPYHFFWLGAEAMRRQDFQAARSLFAKEVERADYNSEFHFWLGLANLKLGDVEAARKQISIAMENSTTRNEQEVYSAKLKLLRSHSFQ